MSNKMLWIDVTLIIGYRGTPVGIVRVEWELANYFLNNKPKEQVTFVVYSVLTKKYHCVDHNIVWKKINSSNKKTNKWLNKINRILNNFSFSLSKKALMRDGDKLFIAGTAWLYPDLLKMLTMLSCENKVKINLVVYDLIPVKFPYLTVAQADTKQAIFYQGCFDYVALFLCISKQTESDVIDYASKFGKLINTQVIRLGEMPIIEVGDNKRTEILNKLNINRPFILYVSTIEARKNHRILYQAYQYLLNQGYTDLPQMLWVGRRGWYTTDLLNELSRNTTLKEYITVLHGINDDTLAALYANCEYTVYASLYEGWGLPVAEALGYGKYCLCSSAASLQEVGQELLQYIDPHDPRAWAEAILQLQDTDYLKQCTQKVKQGYQSIAWETAGTQLAAILQ